MILQKKVRSIALITIALCGLTTSIFAHDAWVQPGPGPVYPIYYGHKVFELYPITKIATLEALDAAGKKLSVRKAETADGVTVSATGKPAMFYLTFDNGYWIKGPAEGGKTSYMNVGRGQLAQGTDPLHPYKFSKTILSWQSWMSKPIGHRVELVPVDFAGAPKSGNQLRLRLLVDGKPMGGQMVENNSSEQGPKTDAEGYVTVDVLAGMNRFATDYELPKSDDPKANKVSLTAVLVFNAE